MGELKKAKLPMDYEQYVFDLYGTLVDIHTDENVRAMRLKESRGYDDEKIASICANQKSPEEFRCACQVMIDNSGNLADTQKQIDEQLGR